MRRKLSQFPPPSSGDSVHDPAEPSQDASIALLEGFDLEEHRARFSVLRFAAATFFSNDSVSLEIGMQAIKRTYPEGKVPVPT
ncbi:MAG: hypothetical protein JWN50_711 [Parcubacteria group bacterium]|nr:hypothetical protein [Parcubacteria group bacterium]